MYKQDLASNNQQGFIFQKAQSINLTQVYTYLILIIYKDL